MQPLMIGTVDIPPRQKAVKKRVGVQAATARRNPGR
jgi:hypothetical protein